MKSYREVYSFMKDAFQYLSFQDFQYHIIQEFFIPVLKIEFFSVSTIRVILVGWHNLYCLHTTKIPSLRNILEHLNLNG